MECFARRYEAFVQVPGKRCSIPPDGLEAPQPAHPVSGLSVNTEGRLIFEVEGDRAENLSQCQSLKFGQDRFRGETFIEALDYGIERYTSTGQVVAAVALFDVFFCHQPNYSGNSFSPAGLDPLHPLQGKALPLADARGSVKCPQPATPTFVPSSGRGPGR